MKLTFPRSSAPLLAALGILMASSASAQPGLGFPLVTIATGQSVRINALNLGTSASTKDSSCAVTLQFIDTQGRQVKQSVVTLTAGKGAALSLNHEDVAGNAPTAGIRVVLLFGYTGGAAPGPGVLQQFDCNIVPSLELYDTRTGRTSVILTDAKPLPVANITQIAGTFKTNNK